MPSTSGAIDLARPRPLHGDHRPLLGGRGEPDLEVGEFGLKIVLHVMEDARRAAGRGGHVEAVGGEAADDAVVHDEAGFGQHQPVAAAARLELRPGIGVEPVHELGGIRTDHLDLAEGRGIEDADAARAPSRHSRATAACMSSPLPGKVAGALPQADILEDRALLLGPVVDRRLAAPDRTGRRATCRRASPKVTGV